MIERKVGPIRLRDWGGGGAPLLLTHGMAAHSHWLDRIVPHWEGRYRVAAIDFRGHGESEWTEDGVYTPDTWLTDIETARRALGWERFLLCGHSMGARIALDYAEARPERLRGVVAVDFLCEMRPDAASSRFARARGRPQPFYASEDLIVRKFRLEPDGTALAAEEISALGRRSVRRAEAGYTWKFDWRSFQLRVPPIWPQLSRISPPALLVRGELSTLMTREELARAASGMPAARSLESAGAHHHGPLDAPLALARAVAEWESGHARG